MLNRFLSLATLAAIGLSMPSCNKDSDSASTPADGKKAIKITTRVTGYNASESDYTSVAIAGGDPNSTTTVWKVNGATRQNEMGIGLGNSELASGTTYTVETIAPVTSATASYQIINFGAPMIFYFKVEVNGQVQTEKTVTVPDNGDVHQNFQF